MITASALRFAVTPANPERYLKGSILKLGQGRKAGTAPSMSAPTKAVIAQIPCGMMMMTRLPTDRP